MMMNTSCSLEQIVVVVFLWVVEFWKVVLCSNSISRRLRNRTDCELLVRANASVRWYILTKLLTWLGCTCFAWRVELNVLFSTKCTSFFEVSQVNCVWFPACICSCMFGWFSLVRWRRKLLSCQNYWWFNCPPNRTLGNSAGDFVHSFYFRSLVTTYWSIVE